MKNLIAQIDEFLDGQHHGWCTIEKAHTLASLIVALRPRVTVEIGVYAGRSGISMAMAHKFINHGTIMAIDPFSKDAAIEGYEAAHKEWWASLDLEGIMQMFLERVQRYHLEQFISLVRAKSDDVTPPDVIELLHIDGQHSAQALRDVERFAANVKLGGICITDDENWPGGGVTQAVSRLMELGFVKLYPLDGGAVYQRIKHEQLESAKQS